MSSAIDLAKIILIEETDKGYTKLVLDNAIPWRTRYLRFNVWRKTELYHDGKPYKAGDVVSVEYMLLENFHKLVSLESVEPTQVDNCLVCYGLYEVPRDGQRLDCGSCSVFDVNKRKRLNAELKLIAITNKQGVYSMGQCLTFVDEARDELYFAWSYGGNPYFKQLSTLKTQEQYNVNGWIVKRTEEGNFVIDLPNVPNLCVQ